MIFIFPHIYSYNEGIVNSKEINIIIEREEDWYNVR